VLLSVGSSDEVMMPTLLNLSTAHISEAVIRNVLQALQLTAPEPHTSQVELPHRTFRSLQVVQHNNTSGQQRLDRIRQQNQ